jgi:hypothetical protein
VLVTPLPAQEFYKWVDENGTVHFTDSPDGIPEKYRNQLEIGSFKKEKETPSGKPAEGEASGGTKENRPPAGPPQGGLGRYEIPYRSQEGSAKRIIIPVTINGRVTADLLLDTGAPGMLIWTELADQLGILDGDEAKLWVQAGGVGGSVPAILTVIDTVQVGGASDRFVPAEVIGAVSEAFDGIIGLDFMSRYAVAVDSKRKVVVFEELPPDPNAPGGHDEEWWRSTYQKFHSLRAEWKRYYEELDKAVRESLIAVGSGIEDLKALRDKAKTQYGEAGKLISKLDRYASQNAVPTHWRGE